MNKSIFIIALSFIISSCSITNQSYDDDNITQKVERKLQENVRISSLNKKFTTNGSKTSNYKKAMRLINSGNRVEGLTILQSLADNFPDYTPAIESLDRMESPFSLSASVVEKYIDDWINAPSNVPKFSKTKTEKPKFPTREVLKKDEFETTNRFQIRVGIAEKKYQAQVDKIKNDYKKSVENYNKNIETYNSQIDWERKSRAEKVPAMRKRYLDIAFAEVLGNPSITNLNYDADNEVFYGKIISEFSNFDLNVKIPVILPKAKAFKEDLKNLKPSVKIELVNGNIIFSKVSVSSKGKVYDAQLLESEKLLKSYPEITIGVESINLNKLNFKETKKLKVKEIIKDNHQFFIPKT